MTDDLITWLLAQLNGERAQALEVGVDGGSALDDEHRYGGLIISGRRLLAETDVKLRILQRGGPVCTCADAGPPMNPETNWTTPLEHHLDCAAYETAQLFALPLADRPGYRDEWRPE